MELDLQMPKHNGRIQRKRGIQGCAKASLEVCKGRIRFFAKTCSRNSGVPHLVHGVALRPEQRYEEKANEEVAARAEVQNTFSGTVGSFQLEDELNDGHLTEGDGENSAGREN